MLSSTLFTGICAPSFVCTPQTWPSAVSSCGYFGIQVHIHPVLLQHVQHGSGKPLFKEGQQPGHHLKQVYFQPAVGQLLGHFQTDETATHNGNGLVFAAMHRAFQPDAVLHGAQGVNAFCICAGDVRHNGVGTCSDHKLIVGLLPAFAAVQITDGHRLCQCGPMLVTS